MEPIIVSASSSQAGTTLTVLRHELLETLGPFWSGSTGTLAASLEAERYLISSELRSDKWPTTLMDGLYVWVRSGTYARTQRSVLDGSFDGSLGALQVDYPYDAALATGVLFEIGVLPAEKYLGAEGANHILNLALRELPVEDLTSITVTATAGVTDTEYSLAGYSWPIKSVLEVVYPRTSTTSERRRLMPRGMWELVNNGESPILSFTTAPGNVGDTIEIKLTRPADTRILTGGSWGDSTTGLRLEDDACLYDALTVVRQARPIALRRLAQMQERGSKVRRDIEDEAAGEQMAANLSRFYNRFRGSGAQRAGASYGAGMPYGRR